MAVFLICRRRIVHVGFGSFCDDGNDLLDVYSTPADKQCGQTRWASVSRVPREDLET